MYVEMWHVEYYDLVRMTVVESSAALVALVRP